MNEPGTISTEEALWEIMQTDAGKELAFLCYYEHDILSACRRFEASEEWRAVTSLMQGRVPTRDVLDLGAGNGIASYAFAQLGFSVTAVEPDPSKLVGYGALRTMIAETGLAIQHFGAFGEALPFVDCSFGLVYTRQVLHHASDLAAMIREVSRVLVPNGLFIASREHVIDDNESLRTFLDAHPLHRYTHAEGAFTLPEYKYALTSAGLAIERVLGPWDSVINHYPTSNQGLREQMVSILERRIGSAAHLLVRLPGLEKLYRSLRSTIDKRPGRMYTFVCKKSQDRSIRGTSAQ